MPKLRPTVLFPSVTGIKDGPTKKFAENLISVLSEQFRDIALMARFSNIILDSDGFVYWGDKKTDGSARIGRIGNFVEIQVLVSGTWTSTGWKLRIV